MFRTKSVYLGNYDSPIIIIIIIIIINVNMVGLARLYARLCLVASLILSSLLLLLSGLFTFLYTI